MLCLERHFRVPQCLRCISLDVVYLVNKCNKVASLCALKTPSGGPLQIPLISLCATMWPGAFLHSGDRRECWRGQMATNPHFYPRDSLICALSIRSVCPLFSLFTVNLPLSFSGHWLPSSTAIKKKTIIVASKQLAQKLIIAVLFSPTESSLYWLIYWHTQIQFSINLWCLRANKCK